MRFGLCGCLPGPRHEQGAAGQAKRFRRPGSRRTITQTLAVACERCAVTVLRNQTAQLPAPPTRSVNCRTRSVTHRWLEQASNQQCSALDFPGTNQPQSNTPSRTSTRSSKAAANKTLHNWQHVNTPATKSLTTQRRAPSHTTLWTKATTHFLSASQATTSQRVWLGRLEPATPSAAVSNTAACEWGELPSRNSQPPHPTNQPASTFDSSLPTNTALCGGSYPQGIAPPRPKTIRPANQPTNQPANRPTHRNVNLHRRQPAILSIQLSIRPSLQPSNQPTNQPTTHLANHPAMHPATSPQ